MSRRSRMSRSPRSRTFGLTLVAVMATACSEDSTAPGAVSRRAIDGPGSQAAHPEAVAPSSVGWQEQARALAAANNMSPLAAGRMYAALSVAEYQAVMAVYDTGGDNYPPADGDGKGGRSVFEAGRGAVAGASARVLGAFFPAAAASLEHRARAEGEMGPGNVHPHFTEGFDIGESAADAVMERVRSDRFTTPWTGTVPVGPDMWIANGPPAGATFGGVRPYLLDSGNQFLPPPPPAFGSPAFLAAVHEIRTMATTRTPAQLAAAVNWDYPTGTFTPLGYWNLVTGDYVKAYRLDQRAATRTFALVHAAMMDALIGCWDAKYRYWTMRPSQADPLITLTFGLPNHPSYPSGHSCASAAAATVLGSLFPERTSELETRMKEAGLSRMYAGIHYRFDIDAGRNLGVAVGRWAIAHANRLD
jgi:membrane-associated phospholipid phosphatase